MAHNENSAAVSQAETIAQVAAHNLKVYAVSQAEAITSESSNS